MAWTFVPDGIGTGRDCVAIKRLKLLSACVDAVLACCSSDEPTRAAAALAWSRPICCAAANGVVNELASGKILPPTCANETDGVDAGLGTLLLLAALRLGRSESR